jgi:tetratricopeptide (TPR) repeat protein
VALLGIHEYQRALREFEIASHTYPDDPELHLNMAEAYRAMGRYNEARSEYEYALRRDPMLVEALAGYAGLLLDAGEFEEAEELLTAAVSERQSYWQAHLYLGWLYVWTDRDNEATHYFQRALRYNPNSLEAMLGLAEAERHRERCDEALAHYQKVVARDPDNVMALVGIGRCHFELGRLQQAQDALEKALSLDPDNVDANTFAGDVYVYEQKYPEAVSHYRMAVQSRANHIPAYRGAGVALESAGLITEAEETYRRGLTYDAYDPYLLFGLGRVYIELGDETRARTHLDAALEAASDDLFLQQRIRAVLKSLDRDE